MERVPSRESPSRSNYFGLQNLFHHAWKEITSNRGSSRDQHWKTFFERREAFAIRIADWMSVVQERRVPDNALGRFQTREDFEDDLKNRVTKLFPEASSEQKDILVKTWASWIEDTVNVREHMHDILQGVASEDAAKTLFFIQTGEQPKGKIGYVNKGPFLYFSFEHTEDYATFKKAATLHEYEKELGCYAQNVKWDGLTIPTLMQVGLPMKESTFIHEGQHFINHRLGNLFASWEPGAEATLQERELKLREAQRAIKDEVLAYLRDGSSPLRIHRTLSSDPLYTHLYEDLDEEQTIFVKQQLETMTLALSKHPWARSKGAGYQEYRDRLVASLLDIPFSSMAKYISRSIPYCSVPNAAADTIPSRLTNPFNQALRPLRSPFVAGALVTAMGLGRIAGGLPTQDHSEHTGSSDHTQRNRETAGTIFLHNPTASEAQTLVTRYIQDPDIASVILTHLDQPVDTEGPISHSLMTDHQRASEDRRAQREIQGHHRHVKQAIDAWRRVYQKLVLDHRPHTNNPHHARRHAREEAITALRNFRGAYDTLESGEREQLKRFIDQHAALYP